MSETHSIAKIKRKDGHVASVTFKELMEADVTALKQALHDLGNWISDYEGLKHYHAVILNQTEEIRKLWDDGHTTEIRVGMRTCAEELEEAINTYQLVYEDLRLLISVIQDVSKWLADHPDYNHSFRYDNESYYYCREVTKKSGSIKHPRYKTVGEPVTLSFPS